MTELPVTLPHCEIDKTSARFDSELQYDAWANIGSQLALINGCCNWWIGDWLLFGVKQYGDRTKVAIQNSGILGYQPETLSQSMWVASSVEVRTRVQTLSWSHHREVADLGIKDQGKWLRTASENKWSVSELRKEIRLANGEQSAHAADGPAIKTVGTKLNEVWVFISNQPKEWWDQERKSIWKERLRPLVEFYQTL